jgi:hypothetical protein
VPFQPGRRGDRDEDRRGREEAWDEREQDRVADPERRDESHRQQRPGDHAEVVHRPLEPVGAAVGRGRDDIRQQCAPRGRPQPAREPSAGPQDADLPRRPRNADQRVQDRRRRVAAHRGRAPTSRIVGERAPSEARASGQTVGDALDRPERRRRRAQRRGQERR